MSNISYHFIVPIWGTEYTNIFTDILLPSLLTDGNLGAFSGHKNKFKIICPEDCASLVDRSKSYKRLKEIMPTAFLIQPAISGDIYHNSFHRFSSYYVKGMTGDDVIHRETAFFMLTPDSLYGDGSLRRAKELIETGYRAVLFPGPRVIKETFISAYYEKRSNLSSDQEGLTNRELVRLFMDHIHKITLSCTVNEEVPFYSYHPAHLYWRVENEGLIYRCFVQHPLLIMPEQRISDISLTADYLLVPSTISSLDKVYVCTDSDEIFGVDLAPVNYDQNIINYTKRNRNTPNRFKSYINKWINTEWPTAYHLWQASHTGYIHYNDIDDKWDVLKKRSSSFVAAIFKKQKFNENMIVTNTHDMTLQPWLYVRSPRSRKRNIKKLVRKLVANISFLEYFGFRKSIYEAKISDLLIQQLLQHESSGNNPFTTSTTYKDKEGLPKKKSLTEVIDAYLTIDHRLHSRRIFALSIVLFGAAIVLIVLMLILILVF